MNKGYLSSVTLKNLTAFSSVTGRFSPGLNVLVGEGGSGKSHMMKFLYGACEASLGQRSFPEKLTRLFMPLGGRIGRLVRRGEELSSGAIEIRKTRDGGEDHILCSFDDSTDSPSEVEMVGEREWLAHPLESVFLPVKEMLVHAPNFTALHRAGRLAFDDTYADVIERSMAQPDAPLDEDMTELALDLERRIGGQVVEREGGFFLQSEYDDLEFPLMAEGLRKLGVLWRLIRNGTLTGGSVLFWDEPEANVNPSAIGPMMEVVLAIQRRGVQVFLATHDYVVLKELDLRSREGDDVRFHALFRNGRGIDISSTEDYPSLHPNVISQVFMDLYHRDATRALLESEEGES